MLTGCGDKILIEHKAPPQEIDLPDVPNLPVDPVDPTTPDWPICVKIEILKAGVQKCALMPEKGKKFSLVDVSFVNCPACQQNFPIFAQLAKDIEATTTSTVLLFKDSKQETLSYMNAHASWFTHPVAYDAGQKQIQKMALQYTPTMYLYDEKGTLLSKTVGTLTSAQISKIKNAVK